MNKSDTIAIIRSLLSSTKSSCGVYSLNADFKKETGVDIPLFGYGTLSDFLHSIPDTVKVSGVYPIQQVQLVKNEKSAHIISLVNRTRSPGNKNKYSRYKSQKDIISNGKIERNPSRTELTDLERFRCIEISSPVSSQTTKNSSGSSIMSFYVPLKSFLDVEETIPPIDINLHAEVGEYIEVCLQHIHDPNKFYFQFRMFKRKFAKFMDKLHEYYETNERISEMTDEMLKPNLICAVLHKIRNKPIWHRAEIMKIVSRSHVIVRFLDHGLRAKVSKKSLKPLHRDFTSLPKQAVLGSLANIRPSNGEPKWSADAVKRFSDLACDKDLVAGVVAMKPETCSMEVALSCTKGSEFHINDSLVNEGYAEFSRSILNSFTGDNLDVSTRQKSLKNEFVDIEPSTFKSEYTKEEILRLLTNNPSLTADIPEFFLSSEFSNERLQKLFSDTEGDATEN